MGKGMIFDWQDEFVSKVTKLHSGYRNMPNKIEFPNGSVIFLFGNCLDPLKSITKYKWEEEK